MHLIQSFYCRFSFYIPSFISYYSWIKIDCQIQQNGPLGKVWCFFFSFYDCQVVMGTFLQDEVWHVDPNSCMTQQCKCLGSLSGWHIYHHYYPPHLDKYWVKQVLQLRRNLSWVHRSFLITYSLVSHNEFGGKAVRLILENNFHLKLINLTNIY